MNEKKNQTKRIWKNKIKLKKNRINIYKFRLEIEGNEKKKKI